jgi:serine/threonine protein kinase
MERIRGYNLEQWLNENDNEPISQDLALDWLRQIAKILFYLHQNGFFHRDIKPSNIIQKFNGKLVLIDFGTARESRRQSLADRLLQ